MKLKVLYRRSFTLVIIVIFISLFFAYYNINFGRYLEQEPKAMGRPAFWHS